MGIDKRNQKKKYRFIDRILRFPTKVLFKAMRFKITQLSVLFVYIF